MPKANMTNIELVKKVYADFLAGDIESILAALSDEIEWITPGTFPTSGTRHGKTEVAKFFDLVKSTWLFSVFEPREYIAAGHNVAVIGTYTVMARATGKTASSMWMMHWKIRRGKIAYFREFADIQAIGNAVMSGGAVAAKDA